MSSMGTALRNSGMSLVLTNTPAVWTMHATSALSWLMGSMKGPVEFTSQDFRMWYLTQGGGVDPPNLNAWGAFWHSVQAQGIIEHTGRYRKTRFPQSHSRIVGLYRKP